MKYLSEMQTVLYLVMLVLIANVNLKASFILIVIAGVLGILAKWGTQKASEEAD